MTAPGRSRGEHRSAQHEDAPASQPPLTDLVLVGYRLADTRAAIRFCDRTFGAQLIRRRVLVLNDPALLLYLGPVGSQWQIVAGSNQLAEFSGWQEGLEHADQRGGPEGGAIFVNDTVTTHMHFTPARRMALMKAIRRASNAALVAFRDRVGGELAVRGMPLTSWASTYCFFLTAEALHRLGRRLLDPRSVADCVPGGLDEASFFAHLSRDLDAHLRDWLFGGRWYAGGRLNADNSARLQLKAKCIIAEKMLSARCDQLGITPVEPFVVSPLLGQWDRLHRRVARSGLPLAAWLRRVR